MKNFCKQSPRILWTISFWTGHDSWTLSNRKMVDVCGVARKLKCCKWMNRNISGRQEWNTLSMTHFAYSNLCTNTKRSIVPDIAEDIVPSAKWKTAIADECNPNEAHVPFRKCHPSMYLWMFGCNIFSPISKFSGDQTEASHAIRFGPFGPFTIELSYLQVFIRM